MHPQRKLIISIYKMTDNKIIEQEETLLLRRKLDLLLRTGKLLVESAADTNRVVRNMKRVAAYLGALIQAPVVI